MRVARDERREHYGYRIHVPTRWMDADPYGHVNNVQYYSFFDTAVTTMLFERGVLSFETPSIGLCVDSRCEFLAPVTFPDVLEAGVRIGRIGDKSLRYEIGLFLAGRDEPAAAGHFIHVFVERDSRRPVSLTEAQRAAIADLAVAE